MKPLITWIKANLALVIFCVIIVVAPIASFLVSNRMNNRIREELKSRVSESWSDLGRLGTATYQLPAALPGTEPVVVKGPLNKASLEIYEAKARKIKQDADQLYEEVIAENHDDHKPIIDGLFPDPSPLDATVKPFELVQTYPQAHEKLLEKVNAGKPVDPDVLMDALNEVRSNYITSLGQGEENADLSEEDQKNLAQRLKKARLDMYYDQARRHSVYADLSVFHLQPWESPDTPSMTQCYDWQEAFWAKEDVIAAIAKANSGDDGELLDITSAPVKRIIQLIVRDRREEKFFSGGGRGEETAAPVMEPDPSQPLETDFKSSLTGRDTRNGLYDVRYVELIIHVASDGLGKLNSAINSTGLLTITDEQITSIDEWAALEEGYLYGRAHVVQVTLTIECPFFREWTSKYMPRSVKAARGVPLPTEDQNQPEEG